VTASQEVGEDEDLDQVHRHGDGASPHLNAPQHSTLTACCANTDIWPGPTSSSLLPR
jgi:hypothetical protein